LVSAWYVKYQTRYIWNWYLLFSSYRKLQLTFLKKHSFKNNLYLHCLCSIFPPHTDFSALLHSRWVQFNFIFFSITFPLLLDSVFSFFCGVTFSLSLFLPDMKRMSILGDSTKDIVTLIITFSIDQTKELFKLHFYWM
jgi:hypothetical protein